MKEILVTGADGLVGSRFVELHKNKDELYLPKEFEVDLTDAKQVASTINSIAPSVIVNFAAYTDVGKAEEQRGDKGAICWRVNVEGVGNLVSAIDPSQTHFIHISTDMVFPGSKEDKGPYAEDHKVPTDSDKLTWYGFTKAEAERIVLDKLGDKATIVRLIYPVRAKFDNKLDYLRKIVTLYDTGKLYPMFDDQYISLCFVDEASILLEKVISSTAYGIYHAASSDTATPHEIASYLIEKTRGERGAVKRASLVEFLAKTGNSPVRYPQYGGLEVVRTRKELDIDFSSWKEIVDQLTDQGAFSASL